MSPRPSARPPPRSGRRLSDGAELAERPLDFSIVRRLYACTHPYARLRSTLLVLVVLRSVQLPTIAWLTARVISGPRIQIPPNLDRDQIEAQRHRIEYLLNQLTATAERWAAGEIQLIDHQPLYRAPAAGSVQSRVSAAAESAGEAANDEED